MNNLCLYREAIDFAYKAHQGHIKNADQRPYLVHPIQVALILMQAGADDAVVIAGILHDVCEDGAQSVAAVSRNFGREIAELVGSVTDDSSLPWQERKERDLQKFRSGDNRIRLLRAADVLANISILLEEISGQDFTLEDSTAQKGITEKLDKKIWYYKHIAQALEELWPECALLEPIRSRLGELKKRAVRA
ncbi:MAG TPA: HD domain-containing protein [Acidobacteriota bacterium]|jgi:(p)ppGpp synthase/HD superfamily hydrolase|nr:HD domain-containing protein [Acidobacteriota bacterium]